MLIVAVPSVPAKHVTGVVEAFPIVAQSCETVFKGSDNGFADEYPSTNAPAKGAVVDIATAPVDCPNGYPFTDEFVFPDANTFCNHKEALLPVDHATVLVIL